jgi:glycosyltransferase involved in cell wall biosynthesis
MTIAKKRVLIYIVCYNAEQFIGSVLNRIPEDVWQNPLYDAEVLISDDQSTDETFYKARDYAQSHGDLPITVLYQATNQGYGGNQKIGYHYAIERGFDAVVLLHGDGQYAPELLPEMIVPLVRGEADVVLGSRMINKGDALRGNMPLYKWVGNQILTAVQNRILGSRLAEFHTGYRAYSTAALAAVPFMENSNYFDFDTDILIQMLDTGQRIREIPIPTFYGEEISRVDGLKYGGLIVRTSLQSRLMRFGIFYHPKFDYERGDDYYQPKLGYPSSHTFALARVRPGAAVLAVAGTGFMVRELASRGARVLAVGQRIHPLARRFAQRAIQADIGSYDFANVERVDTVLLLDILEHLRSPEAVLARLREQFADQPPEVVITTGNIAFFSMRLGLLLGQFNYGKRGILDMDHTRLFTFYSLRNMLINAGYEIVEQRGIPAPFPLALGDNPLSRLLLVLNYILIALSKSLFSYQIAVVARPRPTLRHLLKHARDVSAVKAKGDGRQAKV